MKASELINELQSILKSYGDLPVFLQNSPKLQVPDMIMSEDVNFVIPEQYDTEEGVLDPYDGWQINLRSWPY